jgi:hypothetical protein
MVMGMDDEEDEEDGVVSAWMVSHSDVSARGRNNSVRRREQQY